LERDSERLELAAGLTNATHWAHRNAPHRVIKSLPAANSFQQIQNPEGKDL